MRAKPKTVFLGGGRITAAILAGLRLANYSAPIIVHDRNPSKMVALKRSYGAEPETDVARAIKKADLVILAVGPDSVADVLTAADFSKPVTGVSLAAGVPLNKLRNLSSGAVHWVRAMPSPLSRVRRGLTALTFSRGSPATARKRVIQFFGELGEVLELSESKFDAFTVAYSPSHGYHAVTALAEAAIAAGLDRKTALQAARHALGDAIYSWRASGESLADLLEEAATPGGIAATVMNAMDDAGYQRIVKRALRAGLQRARANSRN